MTTRKEVCECGHDRSSHYEDRATGKRCACTCAFCACTEYVAAADPSAPKGVSEKERARYDREDDEDDDPHGWSGLGFPGAYAGGD